MVLNQIVTYKIIYFSRVRMEVQSGKKLHHQTEFVRSRNISTQLPGAKGSVCSITEPLQIWRHYFDEKIINIIVVNANKELKVFLVTMSLQHFDFLIKCLTFDDLNTRDKRNKLDKLIAIWEVTDLLAKYCKMHYSM